ncbi:hypothetical protein HQ533_01615 [Candidatus Woesearchaeota archaeon]|nr:hypothetical protein [Candidatus Woesearchaeota archaeon]
MEDCILLRYGEIGLKSKRTRPFFERKYIIAIKDALNRNYIDYEDIKNLGGRFILYCKKTEEAINVLKKVPGIQSLSPAKKIVFSSKKDLIKKVEKEAKSLVKNKVFGVRVKRIGTHDFDSISLAKEIGDSIYDGSKGVNLTSPEVSVNLEIRNKECFFYTSATRGIGGLPPGSSENILCLFSGGIDSPVAAFEMLKRGCKVDFLFVDLVGEKVVSDVSRIYNFLITNFAFGYTPKLYIVDGKKLVKLIKKDTPNTLRQIAFKMVLYKIGELIAKKYRHLALIGGEALSQKSSQTLKSLLFIESQVSISMLRPLISLDKLEITKKARVIGTLSSSEKIKEFCNLSDGPVTTSPRSEDLKKIPSFDADIKEAVKNMAIVRGSAETKKYSKIKLSKGINFLTVDLRPKTIQQKKPLNTDLKIPYEEIFYNLDLLKKDKHYLLICEFGVLSDGTATELRKDGIKATGISVRDFKKHLLTKKK